MVICLFDVVLYAHFSSFIVYVCLFVCLALFCVLIISSFIVFVCLFVCFLFFCSCLSFIVFCLSDIALCFIVFVCLFVRSSVRSFVRLFVILFLKNLTHLLLYIVEKCSGMSFFPKRLTRMRVPR